MDTEKAKVFLTVIKEGSLSAAAEKLGYTASGISRSISALEDELGIRLFERGRKGVQCTGEAEAFLPVMRELVHQAERLTETAEKLKGIEEGTITIGISHGGYIKLISQQLKSYADRYPGIRIKTLQATSTELLCALENHDVDLAIMTYRDSDMNFHKLQKAAMVACIPANHPLAGERVFPLRQFEKEAYIAPYPHMDTDYNRVFAENDIHPNIQYTTMDIYAAYCMVDAGLGVSLLSSLEISSWKGNVEVLPTDPELSFNIGIMYPEPANMTIAAKCFLTEMQ